jgi:hypothetical protein
MIRIGKIRVKRSGGAVAWLRRWVLVEGLETSVVPELRDYPLAPRRHG